MAPQMEMYTSPHPLGANVVEYRGIIVVNKVKTRNALVDCFTAYRALCGGELKTLTKLTADCRAELMAEAAEEAHRLGGNAIIGVHFETNTIFQGAIDMVMYGTAVRKN